MECDIYFVLIAFNIFRLYHYYIYTHSAEKQDETSALNKIKFSSKYVIINEVNHLHNNCLLRAVDYNMPYFCG